MRQYRWFFLILIAALLLPGCQTTEATSADLGAQSPLQVKVNPLTISVSALHFGTTSQLEENECLNCHSDKERLIDTAKVEVFVEAESSGVG